MTEQKWVTVKEASLLAHDMGLNRTDKTIRNWCRLGMVSSSKKPTPKGNFKYLIQKNELEIKIKEELEYQAQIEVGKALPELSEPFRQEPESTEQYRKRTESSEPVRNDTEPSGNRERPKDSRIIELESQVRTLEVDRAVRDKQIEYLSKEIEEGKRTLVSQSQFIGHLKTTVYQLGGRPDEKRYLQPPIPEQITGREDLMTPDIDQTHPEQRGLYTG